MLESRTPKYDAAIEPILATLKPGKRTCRVTGDEFEIIPQEIALLRKMRVPPPSTSLRLRRTRLGTFLNYYILRTRKSDKSGKQIISEFSEKSPYQVWAYEEWWADDWSPLAFGRAYDSGRSFFDQFHEVDLATPRAALIRDPANVNSDYVIAGTAMKDCYMSFGGSRSERILYSETAIDSKDSVDSTVIWSCEQCYEGVDLHQCYNCQYCVECESCLGGHFLFDCRGCTDCFMCANLRNKKWCFENKQLSQEEYKKRIAEINLGDRAVRDRYWSQFEKLVAAAKHRDLRVVSSEDSSGDALRGCKGCVLSFFGEQSENAVYGMGFLGSKDIMHIFGCHNIEMVYEAVRLYNCQRAFFSARSRNCTSIFYCTDCSSCENCFGCVGLRNAKFCILNRQYSENEYWRIVDRVMCDMLARGECGEFFPLECAPFPYEDSTSGTWLPFGAYPITDAVRFGARVERVSKKIPSEAMPAAQIPAAITDVGDEVLEKVLLSESGESAFRIVRPELTFYRKNNIPLPTLQFDERRNRRLARVRPLILYTRACVRCNKEVQTTLPPERPGQLLCSDCYLKEVY